MRIDWWTLGLQTVNVLILVAILARFLFRPVIAIMEERQAAAAKALGDAETAKARAIAARTAAEAESAKLAAARDAVLRQAAEDANAQREAALAAAKEDADQVRAAAETEMRWARAAEEAAASDRSARLAVDVAGKLMERLPDSARVDSFIDGLAAALASLPEASRNGFGAADAPRLLAARVDRVVAVLEQIGTGFSAKPVIVRCNMGHEASSSNLYCNAAYWERRTFLNDCHDVRFWA